MNFAKERCSTRDNEGNVFELLTSGLVKSKVAVTFHMEEQRSPEFSEEEHFDPVNQYLPLSASTVEPMFFVINNDHSGKRIFSQKELSNYFRQKEKDSATQIQVSAGQHDIEHYQILTKVEQKTFEPLHRQVPRIVNNIT